jgi:hypothetical protein
VTLIDDDLTQDLTMSVLEGSDTKHVNVGGLKSDVRRPTVAGGLGNDDGSTDERNGCRRGEQHRTSTVTPKHLDLCWLRRVKLVGELAVQFANKVFVGA